MDTVTVHVIPRKRFNKINTTKAVLASRKRNEAGYIMGVIDQLKRRNNEIEYVY